MDIILQFYILALHQGFEIGPTLASFQKRLGGATVRPVNLKILKPGDFRFFL